MRRQGAGVEDPTGAGWDAGYFGLDMQEHHSYRKKIALNAFLGYNTVEHLET